MASRFILVGRTPPSEVTAIFSRSDLVVTKEDVRLASMDSFDLNRVELVPLSGKGHACTLKKSPDQPDREEASVRLGLDAFRVLLQNAGLVPDEWKGKKVVFEGTVLQDEHGRTFNPALAYEDGCWCGDLVSLGKPLASAYRSVTVT